jgi:CBS domain-containing protein
MLSVADVMTTDVRTLRPEDTVDRLRDVLYLHDIGSVLVVDGDRRPIGIVTASDVVEDWEPDQHVATVMTDEVVSISPSTAVTTAARLMLERRIHHLVVGTAHDVVGVVSSWDLLEQLAALVEQHYDVPIDGCER